MKRRQCFFLSCAGALLWLAISAVLALPWVIQLSAQLSGLYAIWAVIGIALLPGYLISAMFFSNLLHTKLPFVPNHCRLPVTVLICARNEQDHIYNAIQSVVRQKYAGSIHILCVDNASTDHTQKELFCAQRSLQRPNRTIQPLFCPIPGKANALNLGLSFVRTEYFITVDADTFLEKNAVAAIMDRIDSAKAGCVAGNLLVWQAKTWVQKMQIYDYLLSIAAVKRYQGSYQVTLVAQGAFSAYRTNAVRRAGGWCQCAGEDIVLTYRLLGMGYSSLYAPQAVGYTTAPARLKELARQRTRWARGMFEGLWAVKPWQQPSGYGGYFESLNLSIVYLDLAYVFGFLFGVVLALLGMPWLVGWLTLLTLPAVLVGSISVYRFQKKIPAIQIQNSLLGLLCFFALFQAIQSVCSLWGYLQALGRRRFSWKE